MMKLRRSRFRLSPYAFASAVITIVALRWGAPVEAVTQNAPAPELVGSQWINTPNGAPIKLQSRRGKVTIVEFWTFGCSNCRANLGAYAKWAQDFKAQDVDVIGVHTPELANERDPKNVARMVKELGITYPILIDGQGSNWANYGTKYWPTIFVIDKKNVVRAKWEGELEYGGAGGTAKLTSTVKNLLAEG